MLICLVFILTKHIQVYVCNKGILYSMLNFNFILSVRLIKNLHIYQ
ncbi:hypothetical protein A1OE_759 [Candidatus Endolissoclinum faulkneri L2]|uniref:Uncharacterized protein n=1 Tax=Candidatus Endolissoclinum faulkneri L2 TaxID=1193729 RepID=K7YHD4_9PROT|nr:hypothetical protein A1OE_759 [Candidatus Endolissoclinum faulkneri L2]